MTERLLDARGLKCPLPILKAKKALKDLPPGETLIVLATDPLSVQDFPDLCRLTGDALIESTEDGETHRFVIRRAT